MKTSITPFLLANLLFCCFFIGFSVTPAAALPVLRDRAKRAVTSIQHQSVTTKITLKDIKILGSYQDSAPYKKNIADASHKAAVTAQNFPVAEALTDWKTRQGQC